MLPANQYALKEILEDFHFILKRNRRELVWHYPDEKDPLEHDFSFEPTVPKSVFTIAYNPNQCTLCSRRISYKKRQFERESPEYPYMILVHNVFLGNYKRTFHDPEEDKIFQRLIREGLRVDSSQLLIREALKCHFGAEDIQNEEWIEHCKTHIQKDIKTFGLKGILILGESARIIFKNKKELQDRLESSFNFLGLPTVISGGPSRLLYMKRKGFGTEKIQSEEMKIKKALGIFSEIMHAS